MQGIVKATEEYEEWVDKVLPLDPADLEFKHEQMRTSSFAFLRATFYRWMQLFPKTCEDLMSGPDVLAVGDLHIENFGTWRDAEGRLVWGINDFDEAAWLPYTNDLVRLAVSFQLAIDASHLKIDIGEACEAILDGYLKSLETGGAPFVLAEQHGGLRRLATGELRNPVAFWDKMAAMAPLKKVKFEEGKTTLLASLPVADMPCELKARRAGLGSLGHPRYVALADMCGGKIAREAKALAPSSALWVGLEKASTDLLYPQILQHSVRCLDPFVSFQGIWLVRRLAPDCSRIELTQLPAERDELRLAEAMGRETANIHLGSRDQILSVINHLENLPKKWLRKACATMADEVRTDFEKYKAN